MNKKIRRVLSFLFAMMFIVSSFAVSASAEANVLLTTKDSTGVNYADSITSATIDDVREILNSKSYKEYYEKYSESVDGVRDWTVEKADEVVVIDAVNDYIEGKVVVNGKEVETAAKVVETYDGVEAIYTESYGIAAWKVNVPKTARYNIIIEYYPVVTREDGTLVSKSTAIERIFRVNSEIPFLEARYLTIGKHYTNDYEAASYKIGSSEDASTYIAEAAAVGMVATAEVRDGATYVVYQIPEVWTSENEALCEKYGLRFFFLDIDKNEIRATMEQSPEWMTYTLHDANGYYSEPFEFVLEAGEMIISLEGVNEPMAIKSIKFAPHSSFVDYSSVKASYESKNYAVGTDFVKIESEYPYTTSTQTIYPVSDNKSALTSPTSTAYSLLNSIGGVGGDKWQTSGQTIAYKFAVNNSGLYNIAAVFCQAVLDGMYTSRQLAIYTDMTKEEFVAKFGSDEGYYDGVPFAEAAKLRFDYSSDWQSKILSDGTTEFEFYFREGVNYKLELSVTLGSMGDIVSQVEKALSAINSAYLSIIKLTGAEPDENRDYGFKRVLPEAVESLQRQSLLLTKISTQLNEMAGVKGSMTATLDKVAWLLDRMGKDPEAEIAKNLSQLKSYIGTLGTWVSSAKNQPLQLDYIAIQGVGTPAPKAKANFLQSFAHELGSFFQSFFRNYDRMGATVLVDEDDESVVEAWLAYGRDQSQVVRNLVNNDFTPASGVTVNLKLVAAGTLLPSILSKRGPDVYIGVGQGETINYAIRGALCPIEDFEGFDEIALNEETRQFNEAAMMVLGIEDAAGVMHYYGLPETQSFNMMFVRKDVLAELDIEIPRTWDDIFAAIPVLQANNMQIGMHTDYKIFLYQMGGNLFADGGMRINLDSNKALDAFETMCNMYTMYSFPYSYDFSNRFRTGEMPIGFAGYTDTYNKLKVFATEIEGLWGMYPMPGTEDEYGNINNMAVSAATAIVMINNCGNTEGAWDFMKWHVGAGCQEQYANEMVAILGPSAKHPTANITALESLPWTREEKTQIMLQFNNLAAIPNYPGSYIIDRYTKFAFLSAYNEGADPVESMLSYINTINKEITRKRQEFDLETLDYVGQKLSEKRIEQTYRLLSSGSLTVDQGVYKTNKDGTTEVVIVDKEYTLSKGFLNGNSAAIEEITINLQRAMDTENTMSIERQIGVVSAAITSLEAIKAKGSLGETDAIGLDKAIEYLNDALEALLTYQGDL